MSTVRLFAVRRFPSLNSFHQKAQKNEPVTTADQSFRTPTSSFYPFQAFS